MSGEGRHVCRLSDVTFLDSGDARQNGHKTNSDLKVQLDGYMTTDYFKRFVVLLALQGMKVKRNWQH